MRFRRILFLALGLAATAIIQSTLVHAVMSIPVRPDLVLLVVVTHSIVRGMEEGVIGGLLGGLIVDLLSVAPFGSATIAMGLIGLATGVGEANIYRTSFALPLVIVFLATVFYHSFLMLALQAVGWNVEWISTLALQTVPGAFLNALLAPVALPFVRRLNRGPIEERVEW